MKYIRKISDKSYLEFDEKDLDRLPQTNFVYSIFVLEFILAIATIPSVCALIGSIFHMFGYN